MHNALVTMALAFTLLTLQQPEATHKKPKPDVGNGRIAWFDITTTDLSKAKEFYGKLFDWQFTALPGAEKLAVEIVVSGTEIGTIRRAEGKISPYDGVVYVQVADAEASCKKAKDLGATIVDGFPFDLSDGAGAIGLIVDPTGHPMGMYSRTPLAKAAPAKK